MRLTMKYVGFNLYRSRILNNIISTRVVGIAWCRDFIRIVNGPRQDTGLSFYNKISLDVNVYSVLRSGGT